MGQVVGKTALKSPPVLLALGISSGGGGIVFDADYQAILDYATLQGYTKPSAGNQVEQNAFLVNLKSAGIWGDLDRFFVFAGDGDLNFAKINWKSPGVGTPTSVGGAVKDPLGVRFPLTTDYFNLNFISGTNGVKYTIGDASFFAHNAGPDGVAGNGDFGGKATAASAGFTAMYLNQGGVMQVSINGSFAFAADPAPGSIIGLIHGQQTPGSLKLWKNGVVRATLVANGSNLSDLPFHLNGFNDAGIHADASIANRIYSCFGIGASLSGKETTLWDLWNAYFSVTRARAAYKAITDYATTQGYALPSAPNQADQVLLIQDLMQAGVWDTMDVFYNFFTNGSKEFARINWKAPTLHYAGQNAGVTFTLFGGFKGDGATGEMLTDFLLPTVNATSAHFGYFCDVAVATPGVTDPGYVMTGNNLAVFLDAAGGFANLGTAQDNTVQMASDDIAFLMMNFEAPLMRFASEDGVVKVSNNFGTTVPSFGTDTLRFLRAVGFASSSSIIKCFGMGNSMHGKEMATYNAWATYLSNATAKHI